MMVTGPSRLIDHFFAITVAEGSDGGGLGQHPTRYFTHPPLNQSSSSYLNNIVPFCFPSIGSGGGDDDLMSESSGEMEAMAAMNGWRDPLYHDFVLTDEQGQKRYATCLRSRLFSIRGSTTVTGATAAGVQINRQRVSGEISCLCFISNQPRFNTMRAMLEEIFICIISGQRRSEPLLCSMFYQTIIPPAGQLVIDMLLPTTRRQITLANPPADQELPRLDFSILFLFETLSIAHVVDLFSMLLLEKSILFHSQSPTISTRCCEALVSLLYPLQWDMVYVPLVPEALKGLTEAPTPFLMAGHSSWVADLQVTVDFGSLTDNLHQQLTINRGNGEVGDEAEEEHKPGTFIKLDIDHDDLFDTHPERNYLRKRLPGRSAMIKKIKSLIKRDLNVMNGGYRDLEEFERRLLTTKTGVVASSDNIGYGDLDTAIRSVFLDWFLQTFASISDFYRADGRFDDRKWLATFQERDQEYYTAFVKTAMFRNFVDIRAPDAESGRPREYFDHLLGNKTKMAEASAQNRATIELDFVCNYDANAISASVFDLDEFTGYVRDNLKEAFQPTLDQLSQHIEKRSCVELLMIRGYCLEKASRRFVANGASLREYDSPLSQLALNSYFMALNKCKSISLTRRDYLHKRIRNIFGRLPKTEATQWLASLPSADQSEVNMIINNLSQKQSSAQFDPLTSHQSTTFLHEESSIHRPRRPSHDTTDHLVLNCAISLNSLAENIHSHIDSNDLLSGHDFDDDDNGLTESDLPTALRELIAKPVELSIRLADMISSMYRILSDPPVGLEIIFGSRHTSSLGRSNASFGSMHNLKGRSPVLDLLSNTDKNTTTSPKALSTGQRTPFVPSDSSENDFVMRNAGKLKSIKKMPTFESFKRQLMVLRFLRLEESLKTEEERLCFWLNIRNTMLLHIFIEFGAPVNLQHRITFIYHKPVYKIGSYAFSVNEITYGILKPSFPIPSFFSGTLKNSQTGGAPRNAGLSPVHVTTTSVASVSRENTTAPTLLHHETVDSTGNFSALRIESNALASVGPAKVPLKFISTDSRSKLKMNQPHPFVNFALIDGTHDGPRMRVYQPNDIEGQLETEAEWFLNHHIEFGKNAQASPNEAAAEEASSSLALILGVGSKKRRVNFPQFLIWHAKDFLPEGLTANELQLLAFFAFRFPKCEFSRYIQSERLLHLPAAAEKSLLSKNVQLHTAVITKVQQVTADSRLVLKIRNHNWEYFVRTCTTLD